MNWDGALEDFDESDEFEAEGELSLSFGTEGSGEEGGQSSGEIHLQREVLSKNHRNSL